MAELAVDAVSKVSDWAVPIIIRHGRYVISPQSSIAELDEAVHRLETAKESVKYRIEDARNSGLGIQTHVLKWVRDVENYIVKMSELIHRRHPTVDCFMVKLPSPAERRRLAMEAVDGKTQVEAYCEQASKMNDVSYHIRHGAGSTIKSVFIDVDTHTRLVTKVFEALDGDDNAGIIGIRGIRGTGKSTVVRTIAARAPEYWGFHKVKIITVLPTVDMDNLRSEIVNFLDEEEVNESQKKDPKSNEADKTGKENKKVIIGPDPKPTTTNPIGPDPKPAAANPAGPDPKIN